MRKGCAGVLAVLTLFVFLTAIGESVSEKKNVFGIYEYGELPEWKGAAVPLIPGLLLTSSANLPEKAENTVLSDGNSFRNIRMILPMQKGHVAFLFSDGETDPTSAEPWPLTTRTELWKARDLYVYHTNAAGDRIYPAVSKGAPLDWDGLDCMILTLDGEAAPGDPILTDGGELVGMITAEYAEGANRYVALTAQGIMSLMYEMYAVTGDGERTGNPEEGYTVTTESNRVTFDWSGVKTEASEGETRWLVVMDIANDYLNYVKAEGEQKSCTMLLTPGRTYLSGLTVCAGTPQTLPERYAMTELAAAETLAEHEFHAVTTTLAISENGESITTQITEPVSEITAEELRSEGMHFYSWSEYSITEKTEDTLLITMTMPDGMNYQYASGWIYDPAYMAEDIWSVPLETTGFIDALEKKGYPVGTYRMAYYVGGKIADSFSFEIK